VDSLGEDDPKRNEILWSTWTGKGWTVPVVVSGQAPASVWNVLRTSPAVFAQGTPTIVMTGLSAAYFLRWQASAWTGSMISGVSGFYPRLVTVGGLPVVSTVGWGAPDGNSVFVQRLGRDDVWTDPVRVSPPGSGAAEDPDLFAVDSSRLVLVWSSVGSGVQSRIQVATSTDRGGSWDVQNPLQDLPGVVTLRSAFARDGSIHMIVQRRGQSMGMSRPTYVVWRDGRWQVVWSGGDSIHSFGTATIARGNDDAIIATWAEQSSQGPPRPLTRFIRVAFCADNLRKP
jgi:hypothetical protein